MHDQTKAHITRVLSGNGNGNGNGNAMRRADAFARKALLLRNRVKRGNFLDKSELFSRHAMWRFIEGSISPL